MKTNWKTNKELFDDYNDDFDSKYRISEHLRKGRKERKNKWREIETLKEKQRLMRVLSDYSDYQF